MSIGLARLRDNLLGYTKTLEKKNRKNGGNAFDFLMALGRSWFKDKADIVTYIVTN